MADEQIPYSGPIVTRAEAKRLGFIRYFMGSMCPRGHISERYTSGGTCTACAAEEHIVNADRFKLRQKASYERHKEKRIASHIKWQKKNPERVAAINKRSREKNPKNRARTMKQWREKNREHVITYGNAYKKARYHADPERSRLKGRLAAKRRRERAFEAGGSVTAAEVSALIERQNGLCATRAYFKAEWCLGDIRDKFDLDHRISLVNGGSGDIGNLQAMCSPCNKRKQHRNMTEWIGLLLETGVSSGQIRAPELCDL